MIIGSPLARKSDNRTGRTSVSVLATLSRSNAYLAEHNASPKPFVWTKFAEVILAKLNRLPVISL
jgi:hypothetical protein